MLLSPPWPLRALPRRTLWVLDGNERARAFYARQGWHADGTSKTEEMAGATVIEVRYRRFLATGGESR